VLVARSQIASLLGRKSLWWLIQSNTATVLIPAALPMKQFPFKQGNHLVSGSGDQMLRKYRVSVSRIAIGIAGTRVKRDPDKPVTDVNISYLIAGSVIGTSAPVCDLTTFPAASMNAILVGIGSSS
jgi:hypothetical protein